MTTQPATDREKMASGAHVSRGLAASQLWFQPFFFPSDLRFHLLDQVCQQCLTFPSGLSVHIAGVFFAIWPDGGVAALPQMVVDLADTAGAWLAALALVGLKGAGGGFAGRSFSGVRGGVSSNPLIDFCRCGALHLVGDMGVDVQGSGAGHMADDGGEGLDIHAVLQGGGGEGMPLRYNYDKPEKPRRIKGFEVFSLVFSSFSKPKNHTEISRIIGGVSLTTNE